MFIKLWHNEILCTFKLRSRNYVKVDVCSISIILSFQVPELAGFWLLTLILQVPMILFLLFNTGLNILPLERAMNIVMALFILFEAICGYFAIRTMVNYQVTKFHLRDFDRIPDDVMYQEGVEPEGRFKQL